MKLPDEECSRVATSGWITELEKQLFDGGPNLMIEDATVRMLIGALKHERAESDRLNRERAKAVTDLELIRLCTDAGVHPDLPEWVKGRIYDFQNLIDEYTAGYAVLDAANVPDCEGEGEELDIDRRIKWLVDRCGEMRTARDTACEIAEAAQHVIENCICERCRMQIENVDIEQVDKLRKVGAM